VALDMDGTLLNSRHEITEYTRSVIRRAMRAGKYVALSTGRTISELTQHIDELGGVSHLICENGALVYDVCAQNDPPGNSAAQSRNRAASEWLMWLTLETRTCGVSCSSMGSVGTHSTTSPAWCASFETTVTLA
jgi:HAD superfamily hydrolase (TIGR01484 family)